MSHDTTEPPPAVKRETWRDWFPESEPRYSVGKLIEMTRDAGYDPVDASALRFWQREGVLPYPNRRKAGTGTIAMYPAVALVFIEKIRAMQKAGLTLKEIRPLLRGMVATWNDPDPLGMRTALGEATRTQEALGGVPIDHVTVTFTDTTGADTSYQYHQSWLSKPDH